MFIDGDGIRVTWSPTDSWELESSRSFMDSSDLVRKKEQVEEASPAGGVTLPKISFCKFSNIKYYLYYGLAEYLMVIIY